MVLSALGLGVLAIRGLLLCFDIIALGLTGHLVSQALDSTPRFNYAVAATVLTMVFVGTSTGLEIVGDSPLFKAIITSLDGLSFIFMLCAAAAFANWARLCQVSLDYYDYYGVGSCTVWNATIAFLWLTWIFCIPVVVWDILLLLGVVDSGNSSQPWTTTGYFDHAVPQGKVEPQPESQVEDHSVPFDPSVRQEKP